MGGGGAKFQQLCWEPTDELLESLKPSGPEILRKSEKESLGAGAPGPQKVLKGSGSLRLSDLVQTLSRFFRDFLQIWGFWVQGIQELSGSMSRHIATLSLRYPISRNTFS